MSTLFAAGPRGVASTSDPGWLWSWFDDDSLRGLVQKTTYRRGDRATVFFHNNWGPGPFRSVADWIHARLPGVAGVKVFQGSGLDAVHIPGTNLRAFTFELLTIAVLVGGAAFLMTGRNPAEGERSKEGVLS